MAEWDRSNPKNFYGLEKWKQVARSESKPMAEIKLGKLHVCHKNLWILLNGRHGILHTAETHGRLHRKCSMLCPLPFRSGGKIQLLQKSDPGKQTPGKPPPGRYNANRLAGHFGHMALIAAVAFQTKTPSPVPVFRVNYFYTDTTPTKRIAEAAGCPACRKLTPLTFS